MLSEKQRKVLEYIKELPVPVNASIDDIAKIAGYKVTENGKSRGVSNALKKFEKLGLIEYSETEGCDEYTSECVAEEDLQNEAKDALGKKFLEIAHNLSEIEYFLNVIISAMEKLIHIKNINVIARIVISAEELLLGIQENSQRIIELMREIYNITLTDET